MRDEKKYKKYKSDTKTNRPESALSENIKLIDFRTFVHPKIRTKNPYQKSVPTIHVKNPYRKCVHQNRPPVLKKSKLYFVKVDQSKVDLLKFPKNDLAKIEDNNLLSIIQAGIHGSPGPGPVPPVMVWAEIIGPRILEIFTLGPNRSQISKNSPVLVLIPNIDNFESKKSILLPKSKIDQTK